MQTLHSYVIEQVASAVGPFEMYRSEADQFPGMLRIGAVTVEDYERIAVGASEYVDNQEGLVTPLVVSSGLLGIFHPDVVPVDQQIAVSVCSGINIPPGVAIPKMKVLSNDLSSAIFSGNASTEAITDELKSSEGKLLAGTGLPAFTIHSTYSIEELVSERPSSTLLQDGREVNFAVHEKVDELLDKLADEQQKVFGESAIRTGYFDGLAPEEVQSLVRSGEVRALYCLDGDEPIMFTLFSSVTKDPSLYSWFNPNNLGELLKDPNMPLSQPLTVTSSLQGLGAAVKSAEYASWYIANEQGMQEGRILYNCNPESVLFLPKFFTEALQSIGAKVVGSHVEVLYYEVSS